MQLSRQVIAPVFVPVTLVLETREELDAVYGSLQVSDRDDFRDECYNMADVDEALSASFRLLDAFDQFYRDEGMAD